MSQKPWRPENWKNPADDMAGKGDPSACEFANGYEAEAGADAMLEKIIKWLLDFEGLGEMELHFAGRRLKALKKA